MKIVIDYIELPNKIRGRYKYLCKVHKININVKHNLLAKIETIYHELTHAILAELDLSDTVKNQEWLCRDIGNIVKIGYKTYFLKMKGNKNEKYNKTK
jgi:hypothetical protein